MPPIPLITTLGVKFIMDKFQLITTVDIHIRIKTCHGQAKLIDVATSRVQEVRNEVLAIT